MTSFLVSGGGLAVGAIIALWYWRKATAAVGDLKLEKATHEATRKERDQLTSELELTRKELVKRDQESNDTLKAKDDTIARLQAVILKSGAGGDLLDAIGADPNAWLRPPGSEDR